MNDQSNRYRIIGADDEKLQRELFGRVIELMGKNDLVLLPMVSNGRELVDLARTKDFDLIFTDNEMSTLDGIDAIKELRKLDFRQPAIIATGSYESIVRPDLHKLHYYPGFDNNDKRFPSKGEYRVINSDPLTRIVKKPYRIEGVVQFIRDLRDNKLPDQLARK